MAETGIRRGVWLGVLGILAALGVFVFTLEGDSPMKEAAVEGDDQVSTPVDPSADSPRRGERSRAPRAATPDLAQGDPVPYIEGLVYGDIDLREAKALMPDNLYWKFGAPTKDEAVLAERDEERRRRNDEYGKVLSGDATEDEVRAYYDYRKRLSSDYLEFAEFMRRRHEGKANDEFLGMLELATKMHAEKLAQMPAELEDALARSRERAKIREEWQRQQQEFKAAGADVVGDQEDSEQ